MVGLHKRLDSAKASLDTLRINEDYAKHGLDDRTEELDVRGIIGGLVVGEKIETDRANIRNFFDRFGVVTEELEPGNYLIKPFLKGVGAYKDEPWHVDLCVLLLHGCCIMTEKSYKRPIFNACADLSLTAGYRRYFGRDYIVLCGVYDNYSLTRYECLTYFLETAKRDLDKFAIESTWDSPKKGLLKEWADAAFRYERLCQMIDEIYHHHNDFDNIIKEYVGTIGGHGVSMANTENPHGYITHINFNIEYTADAYSGLEDTVILNIDHALGIEWFVKGYYDEERHRRYDEGKDTTLRAYVDRINVIRRLEWVEA